MNNVVVIIPVHNEADNIRGVIESLQSHRYTQTIVAIDPRTNDTSANEAAAGGAHIVHAPHWGYDSAAAAAVAAIRATFPTCEYVVFFDAGGKFPPDAIANMLEKARTGASLVLASRAAARENLRLHQKIGTALVLWCINFLFRSHITDISPFRVIRYPLLNGLDMQPRVFRFPSEMLVKCLALKVSIEEVQITLRPRLGRSKVSGNLFNSMRAGFDMFSALQFVRFRRYTESMPSTSIDDALIAFVRILFGVLWLHGASWKEPPLFGLQAHDNLYFWISRAIEYPVFDPFTSIVSVIILPNFIFFAWTIFITEITLGILFISGVAIRPAAVVASIMTVMIALTVLNTPNEWPWSYALMIMLSLLLFAHPGKRFRLPFGRWLESA